MKESVEKTLSAAEQPSLGNKAVNSRYDSQGLFGFVLEQTFTPSLIFFLISQYNYSPFFQNLHP